MAKLAVALLQVLDQWHHWRLFDVNVESSNWFSIGPDLETTVDRETGEKDESSGIDLYASRRV